MKINTRLISGFAAILSLSFFSCSQVEQHGNSNNGGDTLAVKKEFCGVPPDMMIELIKNYKNEVWQKTSDTAAGKYDARFMEISIEQLENFLAYAKQNADKDGLNLASVRMYYINYPGDKKNDEYLMAHKTGNVFEDYAGCHSIALVPVVGADIHDPMRRDYYSVGNPPAAAIKNADFTNNGNLIFVPNNCGASSPMENHNELCPPMKGCITSTLLEVADATN